MKQHTALIASIIIVGCMIGAVAASLYIPGLFSQPKTDFLYTIGDDYLSAQTYRVSQGHLVAEKNTQASDLGADYVNPAPVIYRYNSASDQTYELTFDDATKLKLDSRAQSPDGFTAVSGESGGGFWPLLLAPQSNDSAWYLRGNGVNHKLNLPSPGTDQSASFTFLGWINKGQ